MSPKETPRTFQGLLCLNLALEPWLVFLVCELKFCTTPAEVGTGKMGEH